MEPREAPGVCETPRGGVPCDRARRACFARARAGLRSRLRLPTLQLGLTLRGLRRLGRDARCRRTGLGFTGGVTRDDATGQQRRYRNNIYRTNVKGLIRLILRSGPKGRVSKDGRPTDLGFTRDRHLRLRKSAIADLRSFETRSFGALLRMRPEEGAAKGRHQSPLMPAPPARGRLRRASSSLAKTLGPRLRGDERKFERRRAG